MATSSRQSTIFGVNDWKSIYKTYSQADFKSYDYEALRKSFVDYLRAYYPETFNDYVESSEYVALLDVIAFMGQALSFRDDLNTRENFIDTAERRDSVIKLANLIGYSPKRNLAGQGYLKISSIQTTEQVRDINGLNLSNLVVLWNDAANPNWQEQFNSIINAALMDSQRIGRPGNSQSILNVKTDEYSVNIPGGSTPTIPFSATVDGLTMNFECVSVTSLNSDNVYEISPGPTNKFNILYRNDKLGYGSPNTGFFIYFKQGSLQTYPFNIQEKISNQIVDIDTPGINNTDTWLYQVDQTTNTYTEWNQVDSVYANQNAQTANINRKIFSVTSRFNDQASYIFGDGVFSDIPIGNYTAFFRASNALTYAIDPTELQGTAVTLQYISRTGRTETLTVTLDLPVPVTNAQARETIPDIKTRAPQRYYTQNRMVNGEDYNNFPYTLYSAIIKSKALNRTSVGVARNFDLIDPSGKYSSTNDFAEDGGIYELIEDGFTTMVASTSSDVINFMTSTLSEILGSSRPYQFYTQFYTRYAVNAYSGDGTVYWNQSSYDAVEATGYFYTNVGTKTPISVGVYSSGNVRFISEGALLRFQAPGGFYFDDNFKLVSGFPPDQYSTYMWTSVISITGDGYNNGEGNLDNGMGPVVLTTPVPNGVTLTTVLPSFDSSIPQSVIQTAITNISLNQNFTLTFNNTLLSNQQRWNVSTYTDENYFVKFQSLGSNRYEVTYKSIGYYFGSVMDVRFAFDQNKVIYDPLSGKLLQDYVSVLKTNSQPNSNYPLFKNIALNIIGQTIEADGYVDDYSVEVTGLSFDVIGTAKDPDYFYYLTGYIPGTTNQKYFVFFKQVIDANLLSRYEMVASSSISYAYASLAEIGTVKYEFPVGQIFYAYREGKFYTSVNDNTVANIVNLVENTDYIVRTGRQGLYFQYKHISDKTTRVDPGTTNIVDLYVVTQSYYTQYQNWIKDTSGAVSEPVAPITNELSQSFSNINEYKMLSDSVILNSVRFKPLFGIKADSKLRATIKVIKSGNTTASDSEIRSAVLSSMNTYFSIENWDFGDTFFFSELSAYLHSTIGDLVSSVVLVPNDPTLSFGDLYEIRCAPYEIFVNAAQTTDISVITSLTPSELTAG